MSTPFRRSREGTIQASFHPAEAELLGSLVGQLVQLFRDIPSAGGDEGGWATALGLDSGSADRPTDPVVLRLFPDGYVDDDEAAADFRRFTERGLREAKQSNAAVVIASLATAEQGTSASWLRQGGREKLRFELDGEQAQAWLMTLADLRLALGTRLGVEQDDDDTWRQLPDDDPRRHIHDVYDWLGRVQETLVQALASGLA